MRFLFFYICSFFLARKVSGFDSVQNNSRYFYLKNEALAKFLLPKKVGYRTTRKLRSKDDFNKMTYFGLASYISVFLLFLVYLYLSFCVSPLYVDWDITISIGDDHILNTLNDILPFFLWFMVTVIIICYSLYMEYKSTKRRRLSTCLYYILFLFLGICELLMIYLLFRLFTSV